MRPPQIISRAVAHTHRQALLSSARRSFTSSYNRRVAEDNNKSPFGGGPAPPRLPKEEQELFEKLQRQSTGAFSTPKVNQSPNQSPDSQTQAPADQQTSAAKEEQLYPHLRQAARPEFEGEKNPKTGEIGGPKNEPLRWGHQGDWSYNGRVTDF